MLFDKTSSTIFPFAFIYREVSRFVELKPLAQLVGRPIFSPNSIHKPKRLYCTRPSLNEMSVEIVQRNLLNRLCLNYFPGTSTFRNRAPNCLCSILQEAAEVTRREQAGPKQRAATSYCQTQQQGEPEAVPRKPSAALLRQARSPRL